MEITKFNLIDRDEAILFFDVALPTENLYKFARRKGWGIQQEIQERIVNATGLSLSDLPSKMFRCLVRPKDDESIIDSLANNGVDYLFKEPGDYFNNGTILPEYLVFHQDRTLGYINEADLSNIYSYVLVYNLHEDGSFNPEEIMNIAPFYIAFRDAIKKGNQAEFFKNRLVRIFRISWVS